MHGNHCIWLLLMFTRFLLSFFSLVYKAKTIFAKPAKTFMTFMNKSYQVTSKEGQWFVRPHEDQSLFHLN